MPTLSVTNTSARRAPRLLALGGALLMPLAGVLAQNAIPPEMLRKQEITDADKQVMRAVIDAYKPGLAGATADIKKSRDALVAPFESSGGVSVPFRVAYANALIEHGQINRLAADKDKDVVAANALRVAGQAATGNTLNIILDGLKDPRPSVRYAATVGARAAFIAARTAPAISDAELGKILRGLSDVAAKDTAREPIDGALQALVAAREVGIPNTRSLAITTLASTAGSRALAVARTDDAQALTPLLRVAAALRTDMTDANTLTPDARKAATAFAGQLLVAIDGVWKTDDPNDAMVQAARAAEAILTLADTNAGQTNKFPVRIGPGTHEQFTKDVQAALSVLKGAPYSIPQKTFTP